MFSAKKYGACFDGYSAASTWDVSLSPTKSRCGCREEPFRFFILYSGGTNVAYSPVEMDLQYTMSSIIEYEPRFDANVLRWVDRIKGFNGEAIEFATWSHFLTLDLSDYYLGFGIINLNHT